MDNRTAENYAENSTENKYKTSTYLQILVENKSASMTCC